MDDYIVCKGGCGKKLPRIDYIYYLRKDAYGIPTGVFCDDCYEDDSKYGFKRDKYEDELEHGERIEANY